jgi:hypothetical protein
MDNDSREPHPEAGAAPEISPAPPAPPETLVSPPQIPDDLRVPWTGMDLLIFLLFAIGVQFVLDRLMLALMLRLGIVAADPVSVLAFASSNAAYLTLKQALLTLLLVLFLLFTLGPRAREGFWSMLGWRPVAQRDVSRRAQYALYALAGVPLALAVQLLSQLWQPRGPLPMETFFRDRESVLLLAAMGILVAPFFEETVFRGFLYPVLARRLGVAGGVMLTGTIFGLFHAGQLWGGWAQIALLVCVGIVFTAVRARTGSVIPAFFLHLGYNLFLFGGFFFATRALEDLPAK